MLSEDTMRMEYEDWLLRPHEPSVVKHRFLWDSTMKTQLFKADVNARREQVLVVAGVLCTNVSVRLCVCACGPEPQAGDGGDAHFSITVRGNTLHPMLSLVDCM